MTRGGATKRCSRCRVEKPRSREFFYFSRRGYPMSDCKPCSCARSREWERANNAAHLAIRQNWGLRNPERERSANAAWNASHLEARRAMGRASKAVRRAVATGRLVRPSTCEWCCRGGRIEAAHEDYSDALNIRWLCQSCHRRWDRAVPKSVIAA